MRMQRITGALKFWRNAKLLADRAGLCHVELGFAFEEDLENCEEIELCVRTHKS